MIIFRISSKYPILVYGSIYILLTATYAKLKEPHDTSTEPRVDQSEPYDIISIQIPSNPSKPNSGYLYPRFLHKSLKRSTGDEVSPKKLDRRKGKKHPKKGNGTGEYEKCSKDKSGTIKDKIPKILSTRQNLVLVLALHNSTGSNISQIISGINTSRVVTKQRIIAAYAYNEIYYSKAFKIIGTVYMSIIFVVGFLGNIMVVAVVFRNRALRTPTNCYLVSLAVADCMSLVAAIPEQIVSLYVLVNQWVLGGRPMCSILIFLQYLGINASALSITAFTLERYLAICYPLKAHIMCTFHRAQRIVAGVWLFSVLYSSPWLFLTKTAPMFIHNAYVEEVSDEDSADTFTFSNTSSHPGGQGKGNKRQTTEEATGQSYKPLLRDLIASNVSDPLTKATGVLSYGPMGVTRAPFTSPHESLRFPSLIANYTMTQAPKARAVLGGTRSTPPIPIITREMTVLKWEQCTYGISREAYLGYYMTDLFIFYVLPLVISLVCYGMIVRILIKGASTHPNQTFKTSSPSNTDSHESPFKKAKLMRFCQTLKYKNVSEKPTMSRSSQVPFLRSPCYANPTSNHINYGYDKINDRRNVRTSPTKYGDDHDKWNHTEVKFDLKGEPFPNHFATDRKHSGKPYPKRVSEGNLGTVKNSIPTLVISSDESSRNKRIERPVGSKLSRTLTLALRNMNYKKKCSKDYALERMISNRLSHVGEQIAVLPDRYVADSSTMSAPAALPPPSTVNGKQKSRGQTKRRKSRRYSRLSRMSIMSFEDEYVGKLDIRKSSSLSQMSIDNEGKGGLRTHTAPRQSNRRTKLQVIKMLVIVVLMFAILWVPYRFLVVYNSYANPAKRITNLWYKLFSRVMVFVNSAANPLLYSLMSVKFRHAFRKLFVCGQGCMSSSKSKSLRRQSQYMAGATLRSVKYKMTDQNKSDTVAVATSKDGRDAATVAATAPSSWTAAREAGNGQSSSGNSGVASGTNPFPVSIKGILKRSSSVPCIAMIDADDELDKVAVDTVKRTPPLHSAPQGPLVTTVEEPAGDVIGPVVITKSQVVTKRKGGPYKTGYTTWRMLQTVSSDEDIATQASEAQGSKIWVKRDLSLNTTESQI